MGGAAHCSLVKSSPYLYILGLEIWVHMRVDSSFRVCISNACYTQYGAQSCSPPLHSTPLFQRSIAHSHLTDFMLIPWGLSLMLGAPQSDVGGPSVGCWGPLSLMLGDLSLMLGAPQSDVGGPSVGCWGPLSLMLGDLSLMLGAPQSDVGGPSV